MSNSSQLESIFFAALEKQSPAERGDFLDQACAADDELRHRVERMLAAQFSVGSFLEQPAVAVNATIIQESLISERPGTVIGPYKLLQQIGEGGMGVVFMAEQTVPIQRIVALKIIKPGMDTRQIIARFEAERQALAMMDHPNIAKVLDAGTTVDLSLRERQNISRSEMATLGRPYFVMELVKGVPITKYCDERQLSIRERLSLLLPVCHAVQHAHQKGIIHRDLKPTNVLVSEYDDHTVPKVIDFGVAKATGQKLTDRTMFTEYGQLIGTFEYMSPEQAKFNQLDIDTRSDIYSLGVLMYELLTGSTPFEKQRLETLAFDETLRIIREEEPPKPSTRLKSSGTVPILPSPRGKMGLSPSPATTSLASIAANRHTEPARLKRELHGELDWIVMKALEKDRNRRYETAASLAADIERYRADEPVSAGPPSRMYRLIKFVRRNKVATVASAVMLAGLLAAAIGATTGMISESRRRVAAEREQSAAKLNLANVLQAQGRYTESEKLYRQSLAKPANNQSDQQEAARTRLQLARALYAQGRIPDAEKMMSEAVSDHRSAFPPGDLNTAHAINEHATILLNNLGRHSEAEAHFREVLEMVRAAAPENHLELATKLLNLGNSLAWQQKFAEAEPFYRDSIAQYDLAFPPDHGTPALARMEYAFILIRLKRLPEAEAMALKGEAALRASPPWRLFSAAALASLYARWDEAEPGKGYDKKSREWSIKILDTYVLRGVADESRTNRSEHYVPNPHEDSR